MARTILIGKIYQGMGRLIERGFVEIQGNCIRKVGGIDQLEDPRAQAIDFANGLILPGFIDSHIHLTAYALSLSRVDLGEAQTLEDALEMIRTKALEIGKARWVLGRGWDKQRWGLARFPDRWMLDKVCDSNPVALDSHDGHLLWVNSLALQRAGLLSSIPRVEGGEIEIDDSGNPTGILKEKAVSLVKKILPAEDPTFLAESIKRACNRLVELGITCVHSIESKQYGNILDSVLDKASIPIDVFRIQEVESIGDLRDLPASVKCIKIYADGALSSQTASMFAPYCGQPGNLGIVSTPKQEIGRIAIEAARLGLGVAVHAIGDRANSDVLDAFGEVRKRFPKALLRIEHAQLVRQTDISRFGDLGVIASMQPIHAVADMDVASRYWGERCKTAYAWRSLKDGGAVLAFGSDAPIEDPDPLKGLHAAVKRSKQLGGGMPWYPEQTLSLFEAIDAYTIGGATASEMSSQLGSIDPGKCANLIVVSDDILADPDSLAQTRVFAALCKGVLYDFPPQK